MGIRLYKHGPVVACGIENGIIKVEDNLLPPFDTGLSKMNVPMQRIAVKSNAIRAVMETSNVQLVLREDNTFNTYDIATNNLLGGMVLKGFDYGSYTCKVKKVLDSGYLLNRKDGETCGELFIATVANVDGYHLFANGSSRCALNLDRTTFLINFCKTNWNQMYPILWSIGSGVFGVDYGGEVICLTGVEAAKIYASTARRI